MMNSIVKYKQGKYISRINYDEFLESEEKPKSHFLNIVMKKEISYEYVKSLSDDFLSSISSSFFDKLERYSDYVITLHIFGKMDIEKLLDRAPLREDGFPFIDSIINYSLDNISQLKFFRMDDTFVFPHLNSEKELNSMIETIEEYKNTNFITSNETCVDRLSKNACSRVTFCEETIYS